MKLLFDQLDSLVCYNGATEVIKTLRQVLISHAQRQKKRNKGHTDIRFRRLAARLADIEHAEQESV